VGGAPPPPGAVTVFESRRPVPLEWIVLTWPDYAVLIGSLIVLLAIGARFAREQRDTVDFFLARRQVPWWVACLSFLATEVSAVTIISVPATAYNENWEYA